MAVRTNPRQPVVYDMMLLAHAMIRLKDFENRHVGIGDPEYCERQVVFENGCIKVRALAQFVSAPHKDGLISITDPEFGGTADKRFIKSHFDLISKYVAHLQEQRWKKEKEYPRPKAGDLLSGGKELLDYLKPLMDGLKGELVGDAKKWYEEFKRLYARL